MIVCKHCRAEVWWGLPRPEDICPECGKPIGLDPDQGLQDHGPQVRPESMK